MSDVDLSGVRAALERASVEIKTEIYGLAKRAAEAMRAQLDAELPSRKGVLRRATRVLPIATGARVRNAAPTAHIIESGTRDRVDPTRKNAFRGRVTANPIFVPAAVRARRDFVDAANAVLERERDLG